MKRIFLTGASSGIGRATAELLAAHGHEIWGTARSIERLPKLPQLHPVELDLTDSASVARAFEAAREEAGSFDVLINNAGSGHFDPADVVSRAVLEQQWQILVQAPIELCQQALPMMRAQGHGLIVNITSLAARFPVAGMGAYNAAKAALAAFTLTMQLELGDSPVRIVDVQPADIRTSFNDVLARSADPRLRRTWNVVDANMRNAPGPQVVAQRILDLIESASPPPRVTVGDLFQATAAPFLQRLLPQRIQLWALRKYYGF